MERLDKLLASTGHWSRKEVKDMVRQGRVLADGLPAKKPEELIVRISIHPEDDARVCLNLPLTVFRLGVQHDLISFSFHANEGEMDAEALVRELAQVDFRALVRLIEQGARGMLVNAGDTLTIWTE